MRDSEPTSSHEIIFPNTHFRTRRCICSLINNQSTLTARAFGASKTGGQENWHCQESWRRGTGWQERLPLAFQGDIPLKSADFCKSSLSHRTCSAEKILPAQNNKGILVVWIFDRARDLHTKILFRDGYRKTGISQSARKERIGRRAYKKHWKSKSNLADSMENFWFSFLFKPAVFCTKVLSLLQGIV